MSMNSQSLKTEYLSTILFCLAGLIYFFSAGYGYFFVASKELGDIMTDAALGILFITIGTTFLVSKKSN